MINFDVSYNLLFLRHLIFNQNNMFMKKLLFASALFLGALTVNAQEAQKANVIKVNPLGLLFGSANVGYERALNEKSSFMIAPQFGGFKLGGFKYSSFGGSAQYRFYFSDAKSAPEGFYAAPGLNFTSGKATIDDGMGEKDETKFTSFGGSAMVGNQWIFNSGFVIDLGGGVQYSKFNYKDEEGSFSTLKASGIFPALSFSIGYNF